MIQKNSRYKPLYKKFLRLKINPLSNNKFLKTKIKLTTEHYDKKGKLLKKPRMKKESLEIKKFKKEKWAKFLDFLGRTSRFHKKFKPYKLYSYGTSKFASQGNSLKKKFRNELVARKIFNYRHGGLLKKYLKKQMSKIYSSREPRNPARIFVELFESRLDSVLYRSKVSPSVKNAQQLITHKHIKVNNLVERNKSHILKRGDCIKINSKSVSIVKNNLNRQLEERPDSILWPIPPNYLSINYKTLEIIFGDIKDFDFSSSFTFKTDANLIIKSHHRY